MLRVLGILGAMVPMSYYLHAFGHANEHPMAGRTVSLGKHRTGLSFFRVMHRRRASPGKGLPADAHGIHESQ